MSSPDQEAVIEIRRVRGRNKNPTKEQVAIRFDPDVLAGFCAGGAGWQTRMNAALKEWLAAKPVRRTVRRPKSRTSPCIPDRHRALQRNARTDWQVAIQNDKGERSVYAYHGAHGHRRRAHALFDFMFACIALRSYR